MNLADTAARAAAEIREAVAAIDPAGFAGMVEEIAAAARIACYGVGR